MRQGAEDVGGGATEQHREEGDMGVGRDTELQPRRGLGLFSDGIWEAAERSEAGSTLTGLRTWA